MTKIQSRVIRGNEHESEWPPLEPAGEKGRFVFNRETQQMVRPEDMPRSEFHAIIDDTMPAIECAADGQMYDSKSEYRRALRAHGYVEVAGEKNALLKCLNNRIGNRGLDREERKRDIAEAIRECRERSR